MKMRLRVGAATSAGRIREINEDVYLVRTSAGLFVVCDGMGGGPAGEVASRIAAATIAEHLEGPLAADSIEAVGERRYRPQTDRLAAAVRRSNEVIYAEGQRNPQRADMGSTVVGALVADRIASVAHVGDSRAYLWRGGHLEPLTRDHSLAETLAAEGLSPGASSVPPEDTGLLVRVLGGESDVDVDVKEVPLLAGDFLLLCSDGLTRMVTETGASGHDLADPRSAAHLRRARRRGEPLRRRRQHHGHRRGGRGTLVAAACRSLATRRDRSARCHGSSCSLRTVS